MIIFYVVVVVLIVAALIIYRPLMKYLITEIHNGNLLLLDQCKMLLNVHSQHAENFQTHINGYNQNLKKCKQEMWRFYNLYKKWPDKYIAPLTKFYVIYWKLVKETDRGKYRVMNYQGRIGAWEPRITNASSFHPYTIMGYRCAKTSLRIIKNWATEIEVSLTKIHESLNDTACNLSSIVEMEVNTETMIENKEMVNSMLATIRSMEEEELEDGAIVIEEPKKRKRKSKTKNDENNN